MTLPLSLVLFCLILSAVLTMPRQVWGGDAGQAISGGQEGKDHPDQGWLIQM